MNHINDGESEYVDVVWTHEMITDSSLVDFFTELWIPVQCCPQNHPAQDEDPLSYTTPFPPVLLFSPEIKKL